MNMSSRIPLERIERLIRARVAEAGVIWVWADAARFRKLRRLHERFRREPIAGGDVAFFGPPPPDPGWHGVTFEDAGGFLVVSAQPFPISLPFPSM